MKYHGEDMGRKKKPFLERLFSLGTLQVRGTLVPKLKYKRKESEKRKKGIIQFDKTIHVRNVKPKNDEVTQMNSPEEISTLTPTAESEVVTRLMLNRLKSVMSGMEDGNSVKTQLESILMEVETNGELVDDDVLNNNNNIGETEAV